MENSNHLTESWSLSWQSVLSSQLWRLEHLYWIENKAGQLQRFSLNRAQRRLHERLWYRNDILKARQLGISTYVAMLMLDMSLFRSNFHCGIIDKSLPDAQQKLAKLHFAWDHLDYVPPNPSAMDVALARLGERIKSLSGVEKRGNGNPVRWRAAAWLSPMGAMCRWGLICEGEPCSFSMFPSWRMFPCMLRGEPGKSVRGQSIQFPPEVLF